MQTSQERASPGLIGLFLPCLIVFTSGFCVMVIELVASRLVAGYIGNSLYTWTAVIAVILAGISVGNYWGGILADKYDSKRLVATLFALSAVLTLAILPVTRIVGGMTASWLSAGPVPFLPEAIGKLLPSVWGWRVLVVVMGSFFLPGAILGTISPAIAKWALDHGYATGQTVGSVYSWNTIGSIVGTFVTGFYLIPAFNVSSIVVISAIGLLLTAALFLPAIARGKNVGAIRESLGIAGEQYGQTRVSLFLPCLLVFCSGFCVMIVELVASRLVSGHIGNSLYTWTSVIGVILAGISLGNMVGGWLSDQFEAKQLVAVLFLFSSAFVAIILPYHEVIHNATKPWFGLDLSWGPRVILAVFQIFFLPSAALGTISPAVAKWALDAGKATGRTVGTVYSWNVIGSIAGTFLTGFYLISAFYVNRLVSGATVFLALAAFLFAMAAGVWLIRLVTFVWLGSTVVASAFAIMPADRFYDTILAVFPVDKIAVERKAKESGDTKPLGDAIEAAERERVREWAKWFGRKEEINLWDRFERYADDYEYYDESNYFTIKVSEDKVDSNFLNDNVKQHGVRQLVLDALIHGYVEMRDFKYLHYEYEHIYASISRRLLEANKAKGEKLRVMFMGGGSYTFPRFLTEYYPGIKCDIGEIDPRVTLAVQKAMGLNSLCSKSVYILSDVPGNEKKKKGEKEEDKKSLTEPQGESVLSQWRRKTSAVLDAFKTPAPTPESEFKKYRLRVEATGAILESELDESIDYVLDIRTDKKANVNLETKAKELKLAFIDPAKFEEMYATTSHPNVETFHMDARQYIMRNEFKGEYDVVYGDAFNDFSVPSHLTTLEFNEQMAKLLKPNGIFMANVIDRWSSSKFMGAYANTLRRVFKHVYLFNTDEGEPTSDRSTFVIICSNQPVDFDELGDRPEDIKGLKGSVMKDEILRRVTLGGATPTGVFTTTYDGSSPIKLPVACEDVLVEFAPNKAKRRKIHFLRRRDFDLTNNGATLELKDKTKIPENTSVTVTYYKDLKDEIVLTDEKSPVDNMLARVIETRISSND